MRTWQRRAALFTVGGALVVFVTVLRIGAQQAAGGDNAGLVSGLYFRPLTVFSRGGRATAVAGVPSNTQTYYMGCAGGVWKTTDAGVTWLPVTDGQINVGSIGAVAVAYSNPDVVYVGTGTAEPRGNVSNGDGVYRSIDGGKSWQHVGLEKAGLIGRIVIHPENPNVAYAAVVGNIFGPNKERGVYRTKDGGGTWEQVLAVSENTGAADISMDMKNPNTLYASMWTVRRQPWTIDSGSMEDGLYRSTDGGDHWTKLTGGLPAKVMVGKIGVSVSQANPRRVYALVEAAEDQGGVFRSDDGGDTWVRTNTTRNLQQRGFCYIRIFADPIEPDTVYATNTGAYKSTDGGKTFTTLRTPHGDNHDWWINPINNRAMVESNDGGANVSLDGGQTWSTVNNQPTAEIYRIEVDTRWPYWVYGAQQDNSTVGVPSNNVGEIIPSVGGGESGYIAVDPRNYNIIYAGSYGGEITRQDRGLGITEDVRPYADSETGQRAADLKFRFQWNAPIRLSPHNPDILYTTSQFVHRSKDGGQTWEVISKDLTRNDKTKQDYSGAKGITRDDTGVEVFGTIFAFEESPVTPGLLWAGSDDGLMHISRDNGKTWTNITPPGLPQDSTVNAIDLSPKNAGHAIVTAYRFMLNDYTPMVYQTDDYGATWKRLADGTNGIPVGQATRVVREDPDQPGLLFAGTESGMNISFDDGGHWQRFQLNLPAVPVMDLKIYRHNLIVATEGRGFWILDELPVVEGLRSGLSDQAAVLFKPAEGYRVAGGGRGGGGAAVPPPTFYYWFKDEPTTPVTLQVMDSTGTAVYTATGQPGSGMERQPPALIPEPAGAGAGGRGGRGGAGGAAPTTGRGAVAGAAAGAGAGGGRGGGGFGTAPASISAHKGLNSATWQNQTLPPPFTIPRGIVMWGGRGGQGPKVAAGMYTVKLSMGAWSQSQPFHLAADPRYQPAMTGAEEAARLKMALEVGGWAKQLYDTLAQIRDAKQQAADIAKKSAALAAAAKTLTDHLVAVEGDMTQLQGEANEDALNFPGRLDNQIVVLYGNIVGLERKLNTAVTERYTDLKPQVEQLMQRASATAKTEVAAFNAAAARAGVTPGIVIK
ncbi:MAG: glycosyl hydrolase [Acidobacteriota bacterium]